MDIPSPEMKLFSVLVKISWKTEVELFPICAVSHQDLSMSQMFSE